MKNDKRKFQFSTEQLKALGFVEQPDGSWAKANSVLGKVPTGKHAQQTRALEPKAQTKRKSSAGRKRSNRKHQPPEIIVTMTAMIPRYFDDDNLGGALKPVRDEIADWIGIDDGDGRIRWECGQVETQGEPGVIVKVERVDNRRVDNG